MLDKRGAEGILFIPPILLALASEWQVERMTLHYGAPLHHPGLCQFTKCDNYSISEMRLSNPITHSSTCGG